MDTKTQKIAIKFANHRTNGFILDFLVKALEIEQKDQSYQKIYQRFIKEDGISADEYEDTLRTIIEDILHHFFEDRKQPDYDFYESYIYQLLSYYSRYKLNTETLAASQKQLEFVTLINIFIPLLRLSIHDKKQQMVIDFILPTLSKNSFQNLFELIEKSFTDNNTILSDKLYEFFDQKTLGYDSINKTINKWLKGRITPNIDNVNELVNLYKFTKDFSKEELNIYFKIAKIMDYTYKKSIKYFGKELTDDLIRHFKTIGVYKIIFQHSQGNKKDFENQLLNIFTSNNQKTMAFYLEGYFYKNFEIVSFLTKKSRQADKYTDNEFKIVNDFVKRNKEDSDVLYRINEVAFFDNLSSILPLKHDVTCKLLEISLMDQNFIKYSVELTKLFELTNPKNHKNDKKYDDYIKLSMIFKEKYHTDNNPYFQFIEARFHAQQREYKLAKELYWKALSNGKNSMGVWSKIIVDEGLIVSAADTREDKVDLLNAKSYFTKFYREAYFYKLIKELPEEKSQYFLNDIKKRFDIYFTNLYPNVKPAKSNILTPNLSVTTTKKQKIDLKNPNKLIKKDLPNPITQQMYCNMYGDYEKTVKLLDAGADVNKLKKSDNASALLLTFPSHNLSPIDKERIKIAKLLIPKMSQDALNTQLIKNKETALSYAIEAGLVDIVKLLIKYKADINKKATLDEVTPLYLSIQFIYRGSEHYKFMNSEFLQTNPLESFEELKKLAKANKFSNKIFDEEKIDDFLRMVKSDNPRYKSILDEIETSTFQYYQNNLENYYKIFDFLLDKTENIDIPNGKTKMTPLIFATEINDEVLVQKLLDKGANKNWNVLSQYGELVGAYDYAQQNQNQKLMALLE